MGHKRVWEPEGVGEERGYTGWAASFTQHDALGDTHRVSTAYHFILTAPETRHIHLHFIRGETEQGRIKAGNQF